MAGDEDVFADLPHVYRGLDLVNVQRIEDYRWEADDVIATLVHTAPERRT